VEVSKKAGGSFLKAIQITCEFRIPKHICMFLKKMKLNISEKMQNIAKPFNCANIELVHSNIPYPLMGGIHM